MGVVVGIWLWSSLQSYGSSEMGDCHLSLGKM